MRISGLDELPSRNYALRTYNGRAAIGLGFPILKNHRDSVRLRRIQIVHDVKVKVRFERIAGVSYLADRIARPHAVSHLHFDTSRLQMAIIAVLVIRVIDDHQITSRHRRVWFAGNILNDITTHEGNDAFFCREHSLPISLVVAVVPAFALETPAIGSNLDEIVSEGFGKESLVRIEKAVLARNVPNTFKRETARETLGALECSRGFPESILALGFVIHFKKQIFTDESRWNVHEDI